jgi:spore coat protein U-like protein
MPGDDSYAGQGTADDRCRRGDVRGGAAVTPVRSALIAVTVALLIGVRPIAGVAQFPRGLMMSAEPRGGGSCTIETRPLSFSAYDPLADTDVDAIGQIIYICGSGGGGGGGGRGGGGGPPPGRGGGPGTLAQETGIRIELDQGGNNSFAPRGMVGPGFEILDYNIYLDAQHRTVWGTGAGGTEVYLNLNPPLNTPVTVPAYGRIFRGQDVEAGQYADVVSVRIQF